MNKRRLMITAVAVCLAAILACGSLAYFTSTRSVTNKFYTASYDPVDPPTPDELFSIKIYETDAAGNEDTDGLEYTDILPGAELDKDPTVVNTGRYPAYVRLKVTVTNASAWKAACAAHGITDLTDIFGGFNADWERKEIIENTTADTLTYVYYLNAPLEPGAKSTLFTTVTIPRELTVTEMSELAYFELQITGDAIQSANTGDNALYAFTNYWSAP